MYAYVLLLPPTEIAAAEAVEQDPSNQKSEFD